MSITSEGDLSVSKYRGLGTRWLCLGERPVLVGLIQIFPAPAHVPSWF